MSAEQIMEQRIKAMLGEQLFAITMLTVQLTEATEKISKLETEMAALKNGKDQNHGG